LLAPRCRWASLVAVRLFDEWFSFLPAGSIEPVRSDLELTYAQVAVLLTLMWVGGLVGGLAGIAADRVSRRALASLGALGYGLSLACWGLGQDWWVLAVGSLLLGVSADAMLAACEVALVDLAGDDLVRVLAPGNLGAEVGDLIGPLLLAGSAALGWSWRVPFLVTAIAALAYAAVLASQPLPRPRPTDEPSSAVSDVRACLRDRRVWLLALVSLLFDTLDEPFLGFAIAFLEVERGQSHAVAVLVGGSVLVGGVLGAGAIALGAVGPRILRPGRLPVPPAIVLAASVLGIVIAPAIPLQALCGVAAGAASALFWTTVQARILGLRPGQPGTTAAVVGYLALPSALWPLAAAAIADRFGLTAALWVYVVTAAATAVAAAAFRGEADDAQPLTATGSSDISPSTMR
jgi:MFS family permease